MKKLDKITSKRISALAMAGMLFITSICTSGCNSKKDETQTQSAEVIEDMLSDEINVAPFINDGKILQGVLLKINSEEKFVMGYFYEKDSSLYFHEIFNNEVEYNISYIKQVASDFTMNYFEAANLLPVDKIIKQSITKEEYEEIANNITHKVGGYGFAVFTLGETRVVADEAIITYPYDSVIKETSLEQELTK